MKLFVNEPDMHGQILSSEGRRAFSTHADSDQDCWCEEPGPHMDQQAARVGFFGDVRQKIEAGIAGLNAGRRHSHSSIKREFGVV